MASPLQCSDKTSSMNVEAVLHMKAGLGETSYAKNSVIQVCNHIISVQFNSFFNSSTHAFLQKKAIDIVRSHLIDSAKQVYLSLSPERFTVADLGCSSGSNALIMVEDIIRNISKVCHSCGAPPPEFSVLLNDLPTNDFNTVFSLLPEFTGKLKTHNPSTMAFVSGVPGSFYGRLFPIRTVHLAYSFASLHWLSQVPPGLSDETNAAINKGKMFISSMSPPTVHAAYLWQFQRDFSMFLRSRAAEVVPGGRLVLFLLGRHNELFTDKSTTLVWDLLSDSLASLVSQGIVEQDMVDAYDVPFYAPSAREIEEEVSKEGSFVLDYVRTYEMSYGGGGNCDTMTEGRMMAMTARAVQESMVTHHFGEGIVEPLFEKYGELLARSMETGVIKSAHIGVVLVRS
ncbi:hypothetical protein PR202_ga09998 [Eleusine coracana subsp. coracana]|uniref:Uncharacterized protein n=1 Tax=Eleusine coracana subsp. coracana TaxID=191504 RepID=A0AAV5C4I6_ELECO|nr:hypothetical protein PR202_ga09998 [Eleusine coracana subsp. coracana]